MLENLNSFIQNKFVDFKKWILKTFNRYDFLIYSTMAIVFIYLIYLFFKHKVYNSGLGSWLSAFGSISAVIVALFVNNKKIKIKIDHEYNSNFDRDLYLDILNVGEKSGYVMINKYYLTISDNLIHEYKSRYKKYLSKYSYTYLSNSDELSTFNGSWKSWEETNPGKKLQVRITNESLNELVHLACEKNNVFKNKIDKDDMSGIYFYFIVEKSDSNYSVSQKISLEELIKNGVISK